MHDNHWPIIYQWLIEVLLVSLTNCLTLSRWCNGFSVLVSMAMISARTCDDLLQYPMFLHSPIKPQRLHLWSMTNMLSVMILLCHNKRGIKKRNSNTHCYIYREKWLIDNPFLVVKKENNCFAVYCLKIFH